MARPEQIVELSTDDEVILLKKLSPYGEVMVLMIRDIRFPFHKEDESSLLIDVFAQKHDGLQPIAFKDWKVMGTVANEGQNQHYYVTPRTYMEELAHKAWGHPFFLSAFAVSERYERNNLGSLLIATSLVALNSRKVRTVMREGITKSGRRTWERFGVHWEEFAILIEPALNHPFVEKVLFDFVPAGQIPFLYK